MEILGMGLDHPASKIGAAATLFDSVLHLARNTPPASVSLKIEERSRSDAERAIARYGARRQDHCHEEHLVAGMILEALGRHVDALEAYERAGGGRLGGLVPCFVGISLDSMGRHGEACEAYRESLRLAPGLDVAQIASRTSGARLRNPGRVAGGPPPFTVLLVLGNGDACGGCGKPACGSCHICLHGISQTACASRECRHFCGGARAMLCYARGINGVKSFRRNMLAQCAFCTLEILLALVDPGLSNAVRISRLLLLPCGAWEAPRPTPLDWCRRIEDSSFSGIDPWGWLRPRVGAFPRRLARRRAGARNPIRREGRGGGEPRAPAEK